MKALSIRQPWAWCIAEGLKDVENRTWRTKHRGGLLIHASKTFDHAGYLWIETEMGIDLPAPSAFRRGFLIATVCLAGCVTESDSPWFTGPYGFVLRNPVRFNAVEWRGQLGIFEVPEADIEMPEWFVD